MKNLASKKNIIILLIIIIAVVATCFVLANKYSAPNHIDTGTSEPTQTNSSPTETGEGMNVVVYLQDKEVAIHSDCGVTYPTTITIPKTKAVADASLKYLFKDELSHYGAYKSVAIKNGVAQVTVSNTIDSTGRTISSLSSCEISHLVAVLSDTLTQYESITSVELYSPSGKVEF